MSWTVLWTDNARRSLLEFRDQYEDRRTDAGTEFVRRILESTRGLSRFPRLAPVHPRLGDDSIRKLVVKRHIVIYQVRDTHQDVAILAVRHIRQRDPDLKDLVEDPG